MKNRNSRRKFLKNTALSTTAMTLGMSAKSYSRIMGSNDRINFGVIGMNSRGGALIDSILEVKNTSISDICDVDSRVIEKRSGEIQKKSGSKPAGHKDFHSILDNQEIDAIAIATPDHWHAIMAIMGAKAGKHVYVEKPCCHNPHEGEVLLAVQKKYDKVIQMGNQQRSGAASIQAIKEIRDGLIGDVYFGKAWYSNNRDSIGQGKEVPVPEWLDWELWQGPAPRRTFKDNYVHYNWHWFWNWGTGEINNNGTHELDICRWALGVDYPVKVASSGGRYAYNDDWEFYDTQVANYEFEGGKMITWEGKSCNNHQYFDRGRGVTIHGTKGTIMMDRQGYFAYDQSGKVIKEMKEVADSGTMDLVGGGGLTTMHMLNFCNGIKMGEELAAPVHDGYISNLMPHLGNIAQKCGRSLDINPLNGHILGDDEAMTMWSRDYEYGWEPTV
ncbi:MAG: Gfo/Idh/MocA family oxidoreductase [Saprospiraceae bacterium]|nr:Gfo/Idh/MocA family oxidoreductase [Saprospiraceae bacterium]